VTTVHLSNYDHAGAEIIARDRSRTRLSNAADWHGGQAVKAYRRKDMDAFVRHVKIADQLWGRK
jgi:hypothetical protein